MNVIRCYDVTKMVLDEASETVAAGKQRDAYLERHISDGCAVLDELAEKYHASAFHAEVDEKTLEIRLSMEFDNVAEVEIPNKPASPLTFANRFVTGCLLDEDGFTILLLDVVFGSIWFDLSGKFEIREASEK